MGEPQALDRQAQALGVGRGLDAVDTRDQAGELLAAVAGDEVRRALGELLQGVADLRQAVVAGQVAERVVITMTDRADQAVCLVGPSGTALGCDLELVEPRSEAFVADYLTPAEQALVLSAPPDDARALLANLVWCGKESALKVLRTGLRRDTRSVEVSFPASSSASSASSGSLVDGWSPLEVRSREGGVFPGWWQRFGSFVLTVAATQPFDPPRSFDDPPGLASALPAEAWRGEPAKVRSRE